jgi:glycosyltransferase involved in cell wall biosynthesis
MKVAYLFSDDKHAVFRNSGDSVHIQEMCRALGGLGHSVVLVAAERGDRDAARDLVVHETGRPHVGSMHASRLPRERAATERKYAETAERSWRIGAAAHDTARIAWAMVWNAWFYRHASAILRQERPDAVYERYVPFGIAGVKLATALQLPLVVEMNTSFTFPMESWSDESPLRGACARVLERYIGRNADHVIAVSRAVQDHLLGLGVAPDRVSVLANAADPDAFRPDPPAGLGVRRKFGLDASDIIVGFLGSLKRWHGVDVLLDAATIVRRRNRSIRFLIGGDGPLRSQFNERVRRESLDDVVILCGAVNRGEASAFVNAFDIAVAPAPLLNTFYFSPLKIFEYMATGRAVVAARYPEIETIIDDGKAGLLVQPGDSSMLAERIEHLAARPDLRGNLGRRARESILEHHTWRHRAIEVTRLYDAVGGAADGRVGDGAHRPGSSFRAGR